MRGAHPVELMKRVESRLRAVLNLPDDACFISEDARNVYPPTMPDRAYIITSEGSTFNSDSDQSKILLIESAYIDVTCFNRLSMIDENSRALSLTSVYETNLYEMERRVISALVGWRLDIPERPPLEVASTMKVTRCGKPEFLSTADGAIGAAFMPVTFSVDVAIDICNSEYDV